MAKRSEILEKHIEVAASKAREHEEQDIVHILSECARSGGLASGGTIDVRHNRRRRTMIELLDLRLAFERKTPLGQEDGAVWYKDLVGSIHGIMDRQTNRLLQGLDEDAARFGGGGPLPAPWRDQINFDMKALRERYLKEAEILRDERELEAKMPKAASGGTHITLNINQSSVANLNLGEQIGQIQSIVGGLEDRGLQELADAIKGLTEEIMAAPVAALSDAQKQQAVELVATISEEVTKPPEQRRGASLRAVGAGLGALVKHVDKLAAAYELVKAAARTQGIELP